MVSAAEIEWAESMIGYAKRGSADPVSAMAWQESEGMITLVGGQGVINKIARILQLQKKIGTVTPPMPVTKLQMPDGKIIIRGEHLSTREFPRGRKPRQVHHTWAVLFEYHEPEGE